MDSKKIAALQKMTPAELLMTLKQSKDLRNKTINTQDEYEQFISTLWSELFPQAEMNTQTDFFSLGGTSLQAVLMLPKFKAQYNIELDLVELFKATTIESQAKLVRDTLANNKPDSVQYDYSQDLQLADQITLSQIKPFNNKIETILLTGATGFLGIHLVKDLLEQSNSTIFCIIRASSKEEAKNRLLQCAKDKKININADEEQRIHCLCGDMSKPRLGLRQEDYNFLVEHIDLIIHSASVVNFIYPYERLREANVLGFYELMNIASTHKTKPIHLVSSIGVFNNQFDKETECSEQTNLSEEPPENGYFKTKWVCEKMSSIGIKKGLPISIYRPSGITINSKSLVTSDDDLTYLFMKLSKKIGGAADLKSIIDVVPVDFVSQSIVKLSLNHPAESNVYHLVTGETISTQDLIKEIPNLKYVKMLALDEYIKKATQFISDSDDPHLKNLAPLFFGTLLSNSNIGFLPSFTSHHTQKMLTDTEFPNIKNTILLMMRKAVFH